MMFSRPVSRICVENVMDVLFCVLKQCTGECESQGCEVISDDQQPYKIPRDILWSFSVMDQWNSSVLLQA